MSLPPSTLGPYEIIREIARSNDIVYEAFDSRMNRRVAVKELSIPTGSTDPQVQDRIARFRREAQAVGSLNHANIMTVYSFAEDDGRWYIAMEFLDGVTLRKEIDSRGTIDVDRAVEIACEALDGLAHAHSNGVVHRDIKPDNIQIISSGQVKITDFGIARLTFQPNLTIDGQVFGTPSYMSPEQVVGKEIDARSDLFSVGVMLYEMITGVKPFAGDSVVSITYNIVNTPPNQAPSIPNPIWGVLQNALDKAPSARYRDASEMRDALREALQSSKAPPVAVAPWAVTPPTVPTPGAGLGAGVGGSFGGGYGALPPILGTPAPSPYGQPMYGQPAYGTAAQLPPYTQGGMTAPIYYPPPPRAPLLKPETQAAINRFVGIFVLLGLLFAILFYGIKIVVDKSSETAGAAAPTKRAANAKPGAKPSAVAPATATPDAPAPSATPVDLVALRDRCLTDRNACASFDAALSVALAGGAGSETSDLGGIRRERVNALVAAAESDPSTRRASLQTAADLSRDDQSLYEAVRERAATLDPSLGL